jgi:hypothetical protein
VKETLDLAFRQRADDSTGNVSSRRVHFSLDNGSIACYI